MKPGPFPTSEDDNTKLTMEEWRALSQGRKMPAPPRSPRPKGNLIARMIPKKFSETGAQMTYVGIAGLVAVGVIALGGDAVNVIPIDLTMAVTAFTSLMAGGGAYRQVNKRQETKVDEDALEDDFGAIDDEDLGGPIR